MTLRMQDVIHWIANLSEDGAGILIGIIAFTAAFLMFSGLKFFRKYHAVNKMPTSRVGAAKPGYVKLIGRPEALEKGAFKGPLSHRSCVWYSYEVERYVRRSGSDTTSRYSGWRRVHYETSHPYLLLRDHTGFCAIDMDDTALFHIKETLIGRGKDDPEDTSQPELLTGLRLEFWSLMPFVPEYRYTERIIRDTDAFYALGGFDTLDAGSLPFDPEKKEKLLAFKARRDKIRRVEMDQMSSSLSRLDLKEAFNGVMRMNMAAADPSVLDDFDQDGDGYVRDEELDTIEKTMMLAEYRHKHDLKHINVMCKPIHGNQPFIVSTVPQGEVIRTYQLPGFIRLGLGVLFLSMAAGVLLIRFL